MILYMKRVSIIEIPRAWAQAHIIYYNQAIKEEENEKESFSSSFERGDGSFFGGLWRQWPRKLYSFVQHSQLCDSQHGIFRAPGEHTAF